MVKIALRIVFGMCLLCAAIYLLLHSNFLDYLEGTNLDGSTSITWRSWVALLLITALTQWTSFWAFRRHIAVQVFVGLGICILAAISLFDSSFAFRWEVHDPDGTYLLTWKSDLVIIVLVSISQGASFLILRLIEVWRRRHPEATVF